MVVKNFEIIEFFDVCSKEISCFEVWNITHSSNHWSNEDIMIEYIQAEQASLAIFDNVKGQHTKRFLKS